MNSLKSAKTKNDLRSLSFRDGRAVAVSAVRPTEKTDSSSGYRRFRNGNAGGYFGGSGSILLRMFTVSSTTLPTMCRLCGLSLSTVSCGVCQKTLL